MNTSKVSYDRSRTTFRLAGLAVIVALAGCAGADASPRSGPMPEVAAAPAAEAPRPRLETAPVASFASQWESPFAAQVFGEVDARGSSAVAVRVRPSADRVRDIVWGPLADREQKGNMTRAQVTVSVPTATAVATVAALSVVAQGSTAADEIE